MQNHFVKMLVFSVLLVAVFNSTMAVSQTPPELGQEMPFPEEDSSKEVLPGPNLMEKAANFLYLIYDYIRKTIVYLLEQTLFRENPKLASFYGEVSTFLASITAVYLLLLLIASARKVVGIILLLGWIFFAVAILARI